MSYTGVSISLSVTQTFDLYSRAAVTSLGGTVGEKTSGLESAGDSTGDDGLNDESRDESDDDTEEKFEDDWMGGTESVVGAMLVMASPSSRLQE